MDEKIRVVIVDDIKEVRESIKTLLALEPRIEVVGESDNGEGAISIAKEIRPDIMLLDINLPKKDGIKASEEITLEVPETAIIIMSIQNEQEYFRKAMAAGSREYITKPFSYENIVNAIITTHEKELRRRKAYDRSILPEIASAKMISVFSTKGGVGKTTIATNLAISIARQTKKKVALLDLDLLFGNVSVHLNVSGKSNINELIKNINSIDEETIEDYLVTHFSGVKILTAPQKPEYAEYITQQHIEKILKVLKKTYHYVIMDTAQNFNETTLAALDVSEHILFISTMDLPTIKNVRTGLEVMESLKYNDAKIHVIVNKASEQYGVKYKEFEETINHKIWACMPEDNNTVIGSVNKGLPFVMTRAETKVAESIYDIGSKLMIDKKQESKQSSIFKKFMRA